jgi:predicted MPP superfamily phosphohydrolase
MMALSGIVVCLIVYSLIEPLLLVVNEIAIPDPRIPSGFSGKRIAFLSDIHCGRFLSAARLGEIVAEVNRQRPDMIVLGGDYITGSRQNIKPCIEGLGALKAPLGVYAVLGNHDNWADPTLATESLRQAGITVLDNEARWAYVNGSRLRIGGVGDLWSATQDIGPTMQNATDGEYIILVTHNPQYAKLLDTDRIGLMLAGHTHGGQLLPVSLIMPYLPSRFGQRYINGRYRSGNATIIVTSGIGTVFVPARLLVRPQIVILRMQKTS